MRYVVSEDGNKILEAKHLHKGILQPPSSFRGIAAEICTHTDILTELPVKTDVFHVLVRTPLVPERISTPHSEYIIETDGTTKYLGEIDSRRMVPGSPVQI